MNAEKPRTGAQMLSDLREADGKRIIARANIRFGARSRHYRIMCRETSEERNYETLPECLDWADSARRLMPEEPLSFEVVRVVETEAEY